MKAVIREFKCSCLDSCDRECVRFSSRADVELGPLQALWCSIEGSAPARDFDPSGELDAGPDKGWPKAIPEDIAEAANLEVFVDLAIIKVTNIGRSPVSVSDINLDFGRSGWKPWWRHTIGGSQIPIHDFAKIEGDVRLEAGSSVSVALDSRQLIEYGLSKSKNGKRTIRATATAAGRRPTRSAWRSRWSHRRLSMRYFPMEMAPERAAFTEVFRAVHPYDPEKAYRAWMSIVSTLLQDSEADGIAVADEIVEALGLDESTSIRFLDAGMKIVGYLPIEIETNGRTVKRGEWGFRANG